MSNPKHPESYLVITRAQKAQVDATGTILPKGALSEIESVLLASPRFDAVFRNRDATVFKLAESEGGES
jgi:hypothetical protein